MSLTINTNIASTKVDREINKTKKATDSNFERLSSGKRINKASDDAAGLAIATQLLAEAELSGQAANNISDAVSLTNVAEGALDSTGGIVDRVIELSAQAANGTLSNDQRAAINAEISGLTAELDRIAQTTSFNGQQLLSQDSSITVQVGTSGSASGNVTFTLPGVSASSLGLTGDAATAENARALLDAAKSAQGRIAGARSEIGASQSRLSSAFENIQQSRVSAQESASRIMDADVAAESARLTANNIKQQAQLSVKAQANIQPKNALALLS